MGFESTNQNIMPGDVFDFIAKHHLKTISSERIAIARAMLVDGMKNAEVAAKFNVSRQVVSQNVRTVLNAYEFDQELVAARGEITMPIYISQDPPPKNVIIPAGWKQVTILAPADLVDDFISKVEDKLKNS